MTNIISLKTSDIDITDARHTGQTTQYIDSNVSFDNDKGCRTSLRFFIHADAIPSDQNDTVIHTTSLIGNEAQMFSSFRIHHTDVKLSLNKDDLFDLHTFYDEFQETLKPFLTGDPVFSESPFDFNVMTKEFELKRPFKTETIDKVLMAFRKYWNSQDFLILPKILSKSYHPFNHIPFMSLERQRIKSIYEWKYVSSNHKLLHDRLRSIPSEQILLSEEHQSLIDRVLPYGGYRDFGENIFNIWINGEKFHSNRNMLIQWKELITKHGSEYLTNVCCAYLRDRVISYLLLFLHIEAHFPSQFGIGDFYRQRMVPIPPGILDPALCPPRPKKAKPIQQVVYGNLYS